jgi:SAM-dependent methyltransferase
VRLRKKLVSLDPGYEARYQHHINSAPSANQGVGGSDEDNVAEVQLKILRDSGLLPHHKVLEIGSGTGRLLNKLGPYLSDGSWTGVDIVPQLVEICHDRIKRLNLNESRFKVFQTSATGDYLGFSEFDFIFGFSVFTHMESEDIMNFLRNLHAVAHNQTKALFTFLPLEHAYGRLNFIHESLIPYSSRYQRVRNVSRTQQESQLICKLGGWETESSSWQERIPPNDENGNAYIHQTWLVLNPEKKEIHSN